MIHDSAFIADDARVLGEVTIGEGSSVWFQAVVRGDVGTIAIGAYTNVQDGCVLHIPLEGTVVIGDEVTIGHRAIVHGCTIGNRVLVGMGSIIMDGAEIGDECIIGAGAVITEGTKVPPRSLVLGMPARIKRELSDDEARGLAAHAKEYAMLAAEYRKGGVCHPEP